MANELFAPTNLLEVCQGLQEAIASVPADEQDRAGEEARRIIGHDVDYFGENRLEIRTLEAFALPDGLTQESEIWPVVQMGEMRLRGHLARVAYIRLHSIRTLSWMVMEPLIRESVNPTQLSEAEIVSEDITFLGAKDKALRRPLFLPVGMIESVFIAA